MDGEEITQALKYNNLKWDVGEEAIAAAAVCGGKLAEDEGRCFRQGDWSEKCEGRTDGEGGGERQRVVRSDVKNVRMSRCRPDLHPGLGAAPYLTWDVFWSTRTTTEWSRTCDGSPMGCTASASHPRGNAHTFDCMPQS